MTVGRILTLIALGGAFVAGCLAATNDPPVREPLTIPPTPSLSYISMAIFSQQCVECHNDTFAGGDLNLMPGQELANLVGVESTEIPGRLRVNPGDPDSSYLVHKLRDEQCKVCSDECGPMAYCFDRMPAGGPYLDEESIRIIEDWIRIVPATMSGDAPSEMSGN